MLIDPHGLDPSPDIFLQMSLIDIVRMYYEANRNRTATAPCQVVTGDRPEHEPTAGDELWRQEHGVPADPLRAQTPDVIDPNGVDTEWFDDAFDWGIDISEELWGQILSDLEKLGIDPKTAKILGRSVEGLDLLRAALDLVKIARSDNPEEWKTNTMWDYGLMVGWNSVKEEAVGDIYAVLGSFLATPIGGALAKIGASTAVGVENGRQEQKFMDSLAVYHNVK